MQASRIKESFRVTGFEANLALLIIRGRVDPLAHPRRFPATARWAGSCYHQPRRSEIKMAALDELLGGCGVEAISDERFYVDRYHGSIVATYVNTGDTYSPTILRDNLTGKYRLTSWGDFYESLDSADPEDF
jgi:hypothetical protein